MFCSSVMRDLKLWSRLRYAMDDDVSLAAPLIEILGSGNAFCPPGRLNASMLIDRHILIDAPPAILAQLGRAGVSSADITDLLITHWHGDHVFGLPFLLLHRRYVTDPEVEKPLRIHLRPGGRQRMEALCEIGFPGSLAEVCAERVDWRFEELGDLPKTNWSYERFPVSHVPETDPHGYLLRNDGLSLLHCGDSGPCEGIESRLDESDVVVVEMGVPDFVETAHHHRPSDVLTLCGNHPEKTFLVTHTFASAAGLEVGFDIPNLPANALQVNDGDRYRWSAIERHLERV